ncbi:MAG TPA: hypothetical protein VEL07_13700 [Planctomycetota bacterium]|nr:hypothetical protein [Planctomycetota bacterium]
MQPVTRVVVATVSFAALHSGLASRGAKAAAGRLVGERARDAWYRPFFVVQSVFATAWWMRTVLGPPDREVWRAPPAVAALMLVGQATSLVWMARAATAAGVGNLLGVPGARAWLCGDAVPAPQEAQGPAPTADGMDARGPFRRSRHPLNAAPIPLLWLQPRMTRNRLVATILASAYFVVGSRHEEQRLSAAYGRRYERYRGGAAGFLMSIRRVG